ncbi:MAG: redoxin family protein [Culicoidibacterales bacterium]
MRKILIPISIFAAILASCGAPSPQAPPTTTSDLTTQIPTTTQTIVSPSPPSNLTVNGVTTPIDTSRFLKVGDKVEDASVILPTDTFDTMKSVNVNSFSGLRIIHSVPSLDTPVCSFQTRVLDNAAKEFSNMTFMTIAADLPFAMQRFMLTNSINSMKLLSDAPDNSFAKKNNLYMEEFSLSARAIIIIDAQNVVKYIEYAPEVTSEINIDNAINFLRQNYVQ